MKDKIRISNSDKIIERISNGYGNLQKKYREWATGFKSYEEVISWLNKENIKHKIAEKTYKKQKEAFKLLSSDWNPITIPVLHKKALNDIRQLKKEFVEFSNNLSQDDLAWYLLYFIHPVLHELYYFNCHYKNGYNSRLEKSIRVGKRGWGLKSIENRHKEEGRYTFMFKQIHLHPTTSTWGNPPIQNIKEAIQHLEIGNDSLSSEEKNIAMALSAKVTMTFNKWFDYAQCAINEGPIFTLKENKKHSDCFKDIVKILQGTDQNQDIIRDKLKEYYIIEVRVGGDE